LDSPGMTHIQFQVSYHLLQFKIIYGTLIAINIFLNILKQ
jgi:hypothetical protein